MSAVDRVAVAEIPEPTQVFVVSNLLVCSMLWATGLLFIKLSGDINPFVIAAMRGLIGATSLVLWFAVLRKAIVPTKRDWPTWLFLGTFNGWLPNVLVAFALTQITTASAAMIQASSPLMVALLAHLCFAEEKLTPRRLGGVLVGFVGMAILIGPAAFPNSGVGGAGALAMVATAISYAIANVFVRTVRHADPARLALGQQFCSAVPATILALALSGPAAFAVAVDHLPPLIALGVVSTAMPILLFMRLIRRAGPTRASMVGYLMPLWTAILAVLFLNEHIGLREMIGGVVVLAGVALVSFSGRLRVSRR